MHLSRTILRFSVLLGACLAVAVLAGRWFRTPAVHAEDRETLRFSPQSQTPASAAPTIQVYSRETVVDVTVTDKNGNPIHGLTRDDFTVKEDGKEQPIRSFSEFGAASPGSTPLARKLPPNVYTNLQPPPASSALNILLLDGLNTAPPDATDPPEVAQSFAVQTRVKQGAAKFLKSLPPGARVMVLGLSRGLRILQGASSDPALLSAAVDSMDINMDGRANTGKEWCEQQEMRNRVTLESLSQIASDAAAVKGKKNLIWVSAGFPTITDPDTNDPGPTATSTPRFAHCLSNYTLPLAKTYAMLAAAQVVVYPLGARSFGSPIFNPVGPPNPIVGPGTPQYNAFVAEEELSFESMAEATGGAAFYNSNDLAGLISKAIDKGSNYYTLSYVPPGKGYDWSHHSIKVTVDRAGLKLAYRESYDAVDPATIKPAPGLTFAEIPTADSAKPIDMRAEMGRSMPTSQGVLFDVQVEPSKEEAKVGDPAVFGVLNVKLKGKPLARYGFAYALPGQQIALKPAADGKRHGSLEFDLAAYDGDGKVVTSLRQAIDLNLNEEQAAQLAHSPFRYFEQLDLPAGALFVRVGVLDRSGNKVGTLEIPLTVAKMPQHTAQNTGGR